MYEESEKVTISFGSHAIDCMYGSSSIGRKILQYWLYSIWRFCSREWKLQEFSGRTVDGNLYVVNGGTYTFYGTITVNGNIYVFGDFYNHGTINVSGTLFCLNYYYGGILLSSATKTENGVTTGFSYGNFWNNGKINGNLKVDAQINNIEPPAVHVHTPGAEPTCTQDQVCTTCGAVLKKATGHTPGAYATCTMPQKCTKCGIILRNAKGHVPGAEATCTKEQTCTVCGAVLSSKTPHTPGPKATCVDDQICVECGAVIKNALGHSLVNLQHVLNHNIVQGAEKFLQNQQVIIGLNGKKRKQPHIIVHLKLLEDVLNVEKRK